MGSFVVSWCLWNYRFLVILFSDTTLTQTFSQIDASCFPDTWAVFYRGVLFPLLTSLAYIFVYPYPAKFVYEFTRRRQQELLAIRRRISDETLLTVEESRKLRSELLRMQLAHEETNSRNEATIAEMKANLQDKELAPVQPVDPTPPEPMTCLASSDQLLAERSPSGVG
jgi:hypothetical protein